MKKRDDYLKVYKRLRIMHIVEVALIIILALCLAVCIDFILIKLNLIEVSNFGRTWLLTMLSIGVISVIVGLALSFFTSKILLKPVNELIKGMERLSQGKFDTRIDETSNYFNRVIVGFNSLAKELQSVEIMRTDFINNFSHELKTPIVSMLGLISLLKTKNVSKEKQIEYVSIIEEELKRLSLLTTNILNVSKLEAQLILTDTSVYNLSEQLRRCVLSFEKQLSEKNIELKMDIEEYEIKGSEDLLKQVWINLIDNAIKFSKNGGELSIDVKNNEGKLCVSIKNDGVVIEKENLDKIFNKFYQVDNAYSKHGNGIGLSIVKKVVDLHLGTVDVESQNGSTKFTVSLPQ